MAVNNSLARQDQSMKLSVYLQNDAVKKQINQVVGGKNGTRFISSIVSAVQSTPALQECTSPSIVNAALLGEALNLSPSPQLGQFYMVPFDNKKKGCKEAQFQLGYKGYIQLAIRSGYYKKLNVLAIKEGELVRYDPLDEEVEVNLIDDDILREEAPTMGYFAMFEYEKQLNEERLESALKVALMGAKTDDVAYMAFKLKEGGDLELDDNGNIKGIDEKIAGLKTQFPTHFEITGDRGNGTTPRAIDPKPLPTGEHDTGVKPKDLADAIRMQYEDTQK